jgi:hypothetical protein
VLAADEEGDGETMATAVLAGATAVAVDTDGAEEPLLVVVVVVADDAPADGDPELAVANGFRELWGMWSLTLTGVP